MVIRALEITHKTSERDRQTETERDREKKHTHRQTERRGGEEIWKFVKHGTILAHISQPSQEGKKKFLVHETLTQFLSLKHRLNFLAFPGREEEICSSRNICSVCFHS